MLAATIGPTSGVASSSASDALRSRSSVWKAQGKHFGHSRADVADRQPGEQPVERAVLRFLDRRNEVLGRLLAHALELGKRGYIEPVKVGQAPDQSFATSWSMSFSPGRRCPWRRDGHTSGADSLSCSGQGEGGFVQRKSTSSPDRVRPAHRSWGSAVGKTNGTSEPLRASCLDADHLGDDLAGLLDHHRVADADVLAGDLVGVVQAGPLDGRAGQAHRLQVGHRRQLARLADLDADVDDLGDGLLGLVLEGDRPARALAARPGARAGQVVDLDHQAVGLEIERVPLVVPALGVLDHLLDRVVATRYGR